MKYKSMYGKVRVECCTGLCMTSICEAKLVNTQLKIVNFKDVKVALVHEEEFSMITIIHAGSC